MAAIKLFFNKLSRPLLLSLGISPPLFPGSDGLAYAEFPHSEAPLSLVDWRDILIYLYTFGDEKLRKHGEEYKVVEVARYSFTEAPAHETLVVKVETTPGTFKLLRVERDRGVKDVAAHHASVVSSEFQDSEQLPRISLGEEEGSGSSTAAVHRTSHEGHAAVDDLNTSLHPSISLYTCDVKPGVDEYPKTGVATVQTIFEYDLRELSLMESCMPQDMYLRDFAILMVEVVEYDDGAATLLLRNGHDCKSFANLAMRVLETYAVEPSRTSVDLASLVGKNGAVREIIANYTERKNEFDRKRRITDMKTSDDSKATVSHIENSPGVGISTTA
ncbi:hypothetical protein CPC08DRAFT_496664 [Agrocybe pediades]|nr:hypothetical protein CPC08DRAFT_496664 [Agrocybe pediades]